MTADVQEEPEPPRVLLVDDDEAIRWSVSKGLRQAGFEVDAVARIGEVRELLNEDPRAYAAAILDLELDDGNGGELLWELQEPGNACCAIVLTGYSVGSVVRQLRSRGAVRVLTKPVGMEELIDAVVRTAEATFDYREDLESALDGGVVTLPDPKRRDEPTPDQDLAPQPTLTPRESDVLDLLRRGLTTKDMAAELHLSARTIKFHVSNLLRKYEARSRIDLLARLSS
jgi:DNA-binding NarL/FixJ family response regulator